MGADESSPIDKQKTSDKQKRIDNVTVLDQCMKQQGRYNEAELQQIYETNEIPEEHQTLYTKFHNISQEHQTEYIGQFHSKLSGVSCCRFNDKTIRAIQHTTISHQEWAHIKTCHVQLYKALRTSPRRQHRYNRLDIGRQRIRNNEAQTAKIQQNATKKEEKVPDTQSFLILKQPLLIHTKSHQCVDAENCFDYQQFLLTYRHINKAKEPAFERQKCEHCIIYHIDDFAEQQCECKQWLGKSTEMQHIIHGHWFHRCAWKQLQNEKKRNEERKKSTVAVKYKSKHKHIGRTLTSAASLKRVLAAPAVSGEFNELQFGAPYRLKKDSAKFKNAKQEMLHNEFRMLSKAEWNDLLRKCILFAKAYQARISNLTIKQIVALKLYTDFDELQRHFRKCFRVEDPALNRQRQFFWWNELLEKACNKSTDIIKKKIYHGVSSQLILSTFSGTYYGPVSTTTIYEIARGFAGKSGKILELYPSFGRNGLKVSWLSNFPDEEEILYMNTSFQIHNMYGTSVQRPKMTLIGGFKAANTSQESFFEQAVMEAIQSINVDSKVISLNVNNKYAIDAAENNEIKGDDTSGFVELSTRTQLAVLYLLYLEYRKDEWDNFVDNKNQFVKQAFSRFRSEFVLLAENVKAVKMERLSKTMQVFFYTKQKKYIFPFSAYGDSNTVKKKHGTVQFQPNQPFQIETIIRLFPNAEQISINADNWDFSLCHFIGFLQKFDMDYANVKLQDIYIKFTSSKNIAYEIVTDDERAQRLMNKTLQARQQLSVLRKLGWQFVTCSHLHRVGFEPAPELPFVMVFVRPRNNTKFYYQSYSMRFTKQQIQAIGDLDVDGKEDYEPGTPSYDNEVDGLEPGQISYHNFDTGSEEKSLEQVNDEMMDGGKYVVVQHNPAHCILSANMFDTLEYKDELIAFLQFRKENYKHGFERYQKKNRKKAKFIELCQKVETLVLDPMPKELQSIFMEYPNNNKYRGLISFEMIYKIFPCVKELFLRNTVLNLRICYNLVKFEKEYGHKAKLERVFFEKAKGSESMKDRHTMRFQLVLNPHLWSVTYSECMIQKYNVTD